MKHAKQDAVQNESEVFGNFSRPENVKATRSDSEQNQDADFVQNPALNRNSIDGVTSSGSHMANHSI